MDMPRDGYWHCQIDLVDGGWSHLNELDKTFEQIVDMIVVPYRKNKEFLCASRRVKDRDDIKGIKIIRSNEKAYHYGTKSLASKVVFVPDEILVFRKENSDDYTSDLFNVESNFPCEFVETKKRPISADNIINVQQSQNVEQNQSVEIDISVSVQNLMDMQGLFEDFRLALKNVNEADEKRLKEAQDALDGISKSSTKEQATGVLNKIGRVLKRCLDGASTLGKCISGVAVAGENLSKLKDIYNGLATSFGLPTI